MSRVDPSPLPRLPAAAGVIAGVGSTVPFTVRFLPAILAWGCVGLAIGFVATAPRSAPSTRAGVVYGVGLLIGFFASRALKGADAARRPPFIAAAVIATMLGAICSVRLGTSVRRRTKG